MIKKMLYVGLLVASLTHVTTPKKQQRAVQPSSSSITGCLKSYDLTDSSSSQHYNNNDWRLNHITTQCNKIFASAQSVSPNNVTNPAKVHAWDLGSCEPTTFCEPAAGPITDIQAARGFVATLNSTCPAKVDVWSSCGEKLSCFSNCEDVSGLALNNFDSAKNLFPAYGKHFNRYAACGDFIETCPAAAGRVNAAVTSGCSDYIFVVNDTNNHIECWDNASGVKVSSICATGAVTHLATQDDYVFAVSEGTCNQIQVFDFATCPHDPTSFAVVTAEGPIREMVVASDGPRVFATNSSDLTHLQGWFVHDACGCDAMDYISGFDPLTFCTDIDHIAADSSAVTVYGKDSCEDKMKSYSVFCGDEVSCFTIPKSQITFLATTNSGQAFAVFANAPTKVQKYNSCGGHAHEFCHSTCGDITQIYAAESLIVVVADENHKATIFDTTGCVQGTIESCECITDAVISNDQYIYLAIGTSIKKYATDGTLQSNFHANALAQITMLATTDNSPFIYAATREESIIAFESDCGKTISKYYSSTPIKIMRALSDSVLVSTVCDNVINVLNFQDPCNPAVYNSININDYTCGVVDKLVVNSSNCDRVFVVTSDHPHDVWGWKFSDGCDWEHVICTYNPLCEPCDITHLVSGYYKLFVCGNDFLRNYTYNDGADIDTTFNLHEEITNLASTHSNAVFASFVSDKNTVYRWCSEGGSATAFSQAAQGPIAQLVAAGKYVATLNSCATIVDIWKQDGCYQGDIESDEINDIAVNNRNTEDEDCEGSVYLARGKHVVLYSTDGDNKTVFPQVSGVVSHIASADDQDLVFTANKCNTKIEAFTRCGVFVSHICASGRVTQMIAKNNLVFAVNFENPTQIEIFDFSCPHDPILLATVTANGNISQIAASLDGAELYATNFTNLSEIQGWNVAESCACEPYTVLLSYNPFAISTSIINYLVADEAVVAVFGEAILN